LNIDILIDGTDFKKVALPFDQKNTAEMNFTQPGNLYIFILNPIRGSKMYSFIASDFIGGYSNSSLSDFRIFRTLKG